MNILSYPSVGRYMGVTRDEIRGQYRIIVYGALNAYGLIGPEINGIAVLDEDERVVLLDRHAQQDTGYFGPSREQVKEFERLVNLPYEELTEFVESHPNYRYRR